MKDLMFSYFVRYLILFVYFLWTPFFSFAVDAPPLLLSLRGHLESKDLERVQESLLELDSESSKTLIIEVNSTSGEVRDVLEIARLLYEAKIRGKHHFIVFIDGMALGPAAILPFIADELFTSLFVSWGDVTLGTDSPFPLNILRSRVRSLIAMNKKSRDLWVLLAEAMVDPQLKIYAIGDQWEIKSSAESAHRMISPEGEALVVNHAQVKSLEIVQKQLSLKTFLQNYHLAEDLALKSSESMRLQDFREALRKDPEEVLQNLRDHVHYDPNGENVIGHIRIDDKKSGINQSTWIYVSTALEYYKKMTPKPAFIILELNTPGGEVFSSQQISDALKDLDINEGIPVVTFINNWAVSAGAMLAYSTRYIAITKDATMGAAEPVLVGGDGKMVSASEKINSALRADFANRASFFERNPLIAQAMVDKDMTLVLRHGEVLKLKDVEDIRKGGQEPDVIITLKGKLLTLKAEEILKFGVADFLLEPESLEAITDKELEKGAWPAKKSLLFKHPYFAKIPNATVQAYQMDWRVAFVAFLASPAISSMLFLGLMLGFYMEMNTPGFGFPGALGLVCLFLIMLSSLSLQVVTWLEVIILLVGLAFLVVELLIIPGFGLAGLMGIILTIVGLFAMMLPSLSLVNFDFSTSSFNSAGEVFMERLAYLSGTFLVGISLMLYLTAYVLPQFSLFRRLISEGEQNSGEGYVAGAQKDDLPNLGSIGKVVASLRPAGKAVINEEIYDVLSGGVFIKKGMPIKVIAIQGSHIVVDENTEES